MSTKETELHDAVTNLYRTVTGDQKSTPADVARDFANAPLEKPLEYYSEIGGKVPPNNGHIPPGAIKYQRVETILEEAGLIG